MTVDLMATAGLAGGKWRTFPAYKDAGSISVGRVPVHWKVQRLKTVADYRVSNVDKVPDTSELPVRLCNYTDVYYNDEITPEMRLMETTATREEIRHFGLRVGDVLITKDSEDWRDIAVPAVVAQSSPDLVCGYHLAIIRSSPTQLDGRFLLRALQAKEVNHQFRVASNGITRYGLPKSAIGDAWLPIPPISEQRAIVAFLDRETAKIDALISKKERQIRLLQERRLALVVHAITKGIGSGQSRRAAGGDWLSDTPSHWPVLRLKLTVARCVNGIWGDAPTGNADDVVCVRVADFNRISDRVADSNLTYRHVPEDQRRERALRSGDLLLEKSGGGDLQPVGAVVLYDLDHIAVCSNFVARVEVAKGHSSAFLCYLHKALYILRVNTRSIKQNTGIQNLDSDSYLVERVAVPPLGEQLQIVEYLDRETGKIDRTVDTTREHIEKLREYRTALISAAVTGKIDVREAA